MDLDVLGLTQEDIFAQQKHERMEELQLKKEGEELHRKEAEELRRGMEWLNQGSSTTTRRRKKIEDKPQLSKIGGDKKGLAAVFLSQEQLTVRKLVVEDRKSVFFTGSAGTCLSTRDH